MGGAARSPDGTREAFTERYHTLLRRERGSDPERLPTTMRSLRRSLGAFLPDRLDEPILDAGCGHGTLLLMLRELGYRELHGFDLSPENVALCRRAGFGFVSRHDALDVGSFDPARRYGTVFLVDLLEHLPKEEAVPFLRSVRSRLGPGGCVVARTPNLGSLLGVLERYGDLTHEWGMTERSAADLFAAAGFERDRIEVRPSWEAATGLGRVRETYLRFIHRAVYLAAGRARPRIATPNLIVRAVAP